MYGHSLGTAQEYNLPERILKYVASPISLALGSFAVFLIDPLQHGGMNQCTKVERN